MRTLAIVAVLLAGTAAAQATEIKRIPVQQTIRVRGRLRRRHG